MLVSHLDININALKKELTLLSNHLYSIANANIILHVNLLICGQKCKCNTLLLITNNILSF